MYKLIKKTLLKTEMQLKNNTKNIKQPNKILDNNRKYKVNKKINKTCHLETHTLINYNRKQRNKIFKND